MIGADIVGLRLRALPELTALVPADAIVGGRFGENAPARTILVRTISSIERPTLKRGPKVHRTDRVSATVRAESWDAQILIIEAMRAAAADFIAEIHDEERDDRAWRVSVTLAGTGPDLAGPGNSFEQARDFRVGFDTLA